MLAGLKGEIHTLKSELDEITKMEGDRIKKLKEFIESPDQHFESIKDTSERLFHAEKQLKLADEERKKLLIENDK